MKIGPFENASGLADASIRKRMGRGEVCTVFVQLCCMSKRVEPNRVCSLYDVKRNRYTFTRRWRGAGGGLK